MSTEQFDNNEKLKQIKAHYKILVVEDSEYIQRFFMSALKGLGYQYKIAATGKAAIDIYSDEYFDLVLLDYGLPDISGRDVCEAIRRHDLMKNLRTPIVMQTAQNKEFIGYLDIDGFFTKPISYNQLDDLIMFHIGIKRDI